MRAPTFVVATMIVAAAAGSRPASAGQGRTPAPAAKPAAPVKPEAAASAAASVPAPPPDYVFGPDDVLGVLFWGDKNMSVDAVVIRPDGKITLPLINDVMAAGLTPAQLTTRIAQASKEFLEDPSVNVIVRQINSRKVYITGQVQKPGTYPLGTGTTVLQMIAMSGGVLEYADSKKIVVMRTESGRQVPLPFNYKDVTTGKNLKQNVELKPGDVIIVP